MINRNLHSPTKLTEFARTFDNEPENFLNKVVNRITGVYNSGYNTVNIVPSSSSAMVSPDAGHSAQSLAESLNEEEQSVRSDRQQPEALPDTKSDDVSDANNSPSQHSNVIMK